MKRETEYSRKVKMEDMDQGDSGIDLF